MKSHNFVSFVKSLRLSDFFMLAVAGVVNAAGVTLLLA